MWDHCYKEWNTRNKARHEKDTETRNLFCVMTTEKAHGHSGTFYNLKTKCFLRAQRQCFYPTVEVFWKTTFAHKKTPETWKTSVETYKLMVKQDANVRPDILDGHLRLINAFFRLVRATATTT
ncbi:hypothetical protein IV203_029192 [Nitzschia inconspicua]|uniref:Uncharacterized protein n=1 Tax=Nitzschia inconspicua TaxID=303405 RepID=A0A9K3Q058_9STRA|nr:hypothetical protein IV203_029192 [Nitzschia inconspicua]